MLENIAWKSQICKFGFVSQKIQPNVIAYFKPRAKEFELNKKYICLKNILDYE